MPGFTTGQQESIRILSYVQMSNDLLSNPQAPASVAIVGSGAIGSYYGGRLTEHGHDVHFLMRSDYSTVQQQGLVVTSCRGDFTLSPSQLHLYDDVKKMPKVDLVIVTLKTTANDQYAPLITPLLHESTAILTLQNGLGNEARLAELFGRDRVLGGLAFICCNRLSPGRIDHSAHGLIRMGEFSRHGISPRLAALGKLFNASNIQCDVIANLDEGRWEKLVWNIPFNGLGALLDQATDRLIGSPEGLGLVRRLMEEVVAGAAGNGIHLAEGTIDHQVNRTRVMDAYLTSMQIDRQLNRPLEIEAILGEPVRQAESAGVQVPTMRMLYELMVMATRPST